MNKSLWGYRHAALNLLTGEVISCSRSCDLKRAVARYGRYEEHSKWVFTHSGSFRPEQFAGAPYTR